MKKFLVLMMVMVLGVLVVACGESGEASSAQSDSAATEVTDEAGIFTPGTYTGTAQGAGEITAVVTVDANSIVSIELDVSNETASNAVEVADQMSQDIIGQQSADVDAISGATTTSGGIKEAVADALNQAKN